MAYQPTGVQTMFPVYLQRMAAAGQTRESYDIAVAQNEANLNQNLDSINYDVSRIVLEQEHMNKTKTAERLGISRSTLWRILQK